MSAKYPKITDAQVEQQDKFGRFNAVEVASLLQSFGRNHVSGNVTAGSTGVTVTEQLTVAEDKIRVASVKFLINTVQTGTGNTPDLNLKVGSTVVATKSALALGGAAGDIVVLTLSATDANLLVAKGAVIKAEIVNPAGTITVALSGKFIIEYYTVAD